MKQTLGQNLMNQQTGSFLTQYRSAYLTALLLFTVSYLPNALAQETAQTTAIKTSSSNTATQNNLTSDVDSINQHEINEATGIHTITSTLSEPSMADASLISPQNQTNIPNTSNDDTAATLPHNLSPWGMFMAADWVVKTVMIILAMASLLTWTILVSKTIELNILKRRLRVNLCNITTAYTLTDAANANDIIGVGRDFIEAAETELHLSSELAHKEGGKDGIKERVISSLSRIEVAYTRRMMLGTGLLATIGAIAPFVGLLGTVWGIMNSFIGISKAQTTNLAVVAPGIAEALLATALGLVAAIPAVIIYNHFTRQIGTAKSLVSDSAAGVMRLVSRDLDRGTNLRIVKTTSTQAAE
ncbi:tonB-system energizer ExbB [Shewanella sp. A14]